MHWEPDVGLDPGSPGSRPGPKAGAKPLRHPGIPVFDTNIQTISKKKKNAKPLSFKVEIGKVIRGWDEALLTMSKGEKARLEIEPEWAYGKKGQPDAKYPFFPL